MNFQRFLKSYVSSIFAIGLLGCPSSAQHLGVKVFQRIATLCNVDASLNRQPSLEASERLSQKFRESDTYVQAKKMFDFYLTIFERKSSCTEDQTEEGFFKKLLDFVESCGLSDEEKQMALCCLKRSIEKGTIIWTNGEDDPHYKDWLQRMRQNEDQSSGGRWNFLRYSLKSRSVLWASFKDEFSVLAGPLHELFHGVDFAKGEKLYREGKIKDEHSNELMRRMTKGEPLTSREEEDLLFNPCHEERFSVLAELLALLKGPHGSQVDILLTARILPFIKCCLVENILCNPEKFAFPVRLAQPSETDCLAKTHQKQLFESLRNDPRISSTFRFIENNPELRAYAHSDILWYLWRLASGAEESLRGLHSPDYLEDFACALVVLANFSANGMSNMLNAVANMKVPTALKVQTAAKMVLGMATDKDI